VKRLFAVSILVCAAAINGVAFASESNGTVNATHKYAWGEKLGWINYAPEHGGVTNNCAGELGGKAWSSTKGWIDMTGVTISSSGVFAGTAGDADTTAGRIKLDCLECSVTTDWIPCASRPVTETVSDTTVTTEGGSGGPATMSTVEAKSFNTGFNDQVVESFFASIAEKADANGDGMVNMSDFSDMIANWGMNTSGGGGVSDLDGNGSVDLRDINLLMVSWGTL